MCNKSVVESSDLVKVLPPGGGGGDDLRGERASGVYEKEKVLKPTQRELRAERPSQQAWARGM